MKIPCIKLTSEIWEYIKPYLERWGYNITSVNPRHINIFPILVINELGIIGRCNNYRESGVIIDDYNRIFITDVEEFLKKAAKLKGFEYKRKIKMNTFTKSDLKPGMIVEYASGSRRLILNSDKGLFLAGLNIYCSLEPYNDNLCCEKCPAFTINKVYENNGQVELNYILKSSQLKLVWERPQTVELSLQEIAEKFNVPVEVIRIKEN